MQTEKAKSSHFDRTRGDKNQIFPTYASSDWVEGSSKKEAVYTKAKVFLIG
jgi:hypothetical protein